MAAPRRSGAEHGIAGRGRSPGDTRMAGGARRGRRERRSAARAVPARARRRPRAAHRRGPGARGHDAVPEHDPAPGRAASSRRRGARAASTQHRPLERDRDDPQREQDLLRARRPHRQLPVRGGPLRDRLQPLLARAGGQARRRPRLHAGPFEPRRLRPRVPRGADPRGADAQVPHGGRRRRAAAPTRTRG